MRSIFVTATNTNVGKTYATMHLMERYAKIGLKVGAYKPIETGVKDMPNDGEKLYELAKKLNPSYRSLKIDDIVTYKFELPASPFVASDCVIDLEYIKSEYERVQKHCDILFVEGAGGLMVPITKDFFMVDLANFLDMHTILITPSRLGCINDTLMSLEILKTRANSHEWYVNYYEEKESFLKVSAPFYDAYFGGYKFLS